LPTINDVAKRAGVSAVTVSRVINNASNVRPATRDKVELAIRELGYVPSVAARSLRLKRTRTLALILPDITNTFWTTIHSPRRGGRRSATRLFGFSVQHG
jgi:LacI family transcriptional regulator